MGLPTLSELGLPNILEQARNVDGPGYNMALVFELVAHRSAARATKICEGLPELKDTEGIGIVQSVEATALEEISDSDLLLNVHDLEITIEVVRGVFQDVLNSDEIMAKEIKTVYGIDTSLPQEEQLAVASNLHMLRVLAQVKSKLPEIERNVKIRRKCGRHLDRSIILVYLERVSR